MKSSIKPKPAHWPWSNFKEPNPVQVPGNSVIVYGEPATGKSINAQKICSHFGLSKVVDDWDTRHKIPPNTLILTNDSTVLNQYKCVEVKDVLKELGVSYKEKP